MVLGTVEGGIEVRVQGGWSELLDDEVSVV